MEEENIIFSYTTKEAVADGTLIKVEPEAYSKAGIKFPVYLTNTVWKRYIRIHENNKKVEPVKNRVFSFLWMFAQQARKVSGSTFTYRVFLSLPDTYELWDNEMETSNKRRLISLKAVITAQDIDDPSPAIFIMLPSED